MKLYHFTKFESFNRIVSENTFCLSSFENANDYKELAGREFELGCKIQDYKYFSTCASTTPDGLDIQSFANAMMWHFYGDRHNGICIEFELDRILKAADKIIKYGYINYRGGVTHIDKQSLLSYLLEKRLCWQGENEYRFIFLNTAPDIVNINSCITSVYFGANLKDENLHTCHLPANAILYKMYVDKTDGRLNRIRINNHEYPRC